MKPQPRTQPLDLRSRAGLAAPASGEEASFVDLAAPGELFVSSSEAKADTNPAAEFEPGEGEQLKNEADGPESLSGRGSVERFVSVSETIGPANGNGFAQVDQGSSSSAAVSEGDSGIEPCAEGEEGGPGLPGGSQSSKGAPADVSGAAADAFSKAEQQDKKKGGGFFLHGL